MEYNKVKQEINNMVSDNVKALAQLFPAAVKDGEVDFESLQEELGQFKEVSSEKYELTWAGKQNSKKIALEDVVGKTLKFIPDDSKNADTTENLYIEGDNLEVLKLLRQNYYGAIKMIYIDPPYNTGNDFIYNDNFAMSTMDSEMAEGNIGQNSEKFSINSKSLNRYHANWLNMIYSRLLVSKHLLKDDGVVFISIDDNELYDLKKVCDLILGETNYCGTFIINSSPSAIDYGNIANMHEYALMYAKNKECLQIYQLPEKDKKFKYEDEMGGFNLYPLYNGNVAFNPQTRPNLYYPFYLNLNNEIAPRFYEISLEKKEGWIEVCPVVSKKDGIQRVWRWGKEKANKNLNGEIIGFLNDSNEYRIVQKSRLTTKSIRSIQYDGEVSSRRGTAEIQNLFKKKVFSFPKPVELVKRFLTVGTADDDLILDFFAGSSTTAHATMQLNAEDGGNRKFIMVQLLEDIPNESEAQKLGYKNIADIGKDRIRKAGEKIILENPVLKGKLDIGFKTFKVDKTNIKWNLVDDTENMQLTTDTASYTPDLIDFVVGTNDTDVIYELMLRQRDVSLSASLEQLTDIGQRTYLYSSSYLVCLETEITEELVDKLAALNPLPIKFIFRDSAFKDDIALKDETFRRLKALIEKNSGISKKTYTVEFI